MKASDKRKKSHAKNLAGKARRERARQGNPQSTMPESPRLPEGTRPAREPESVTLPLLMAAAENIFLTAPVQEWLAQLIAPEAGDLLTQALWDSKIPMPKGYQLNAKTSLCILAAAEVVAAGIGNPSPNLPANVAAWIIKQDALYSPGIVGLASAAVEQVATESELCNLWQQVGAIDRFRQGINDLLGRLHSHDFAEWKDLLGNLRL